MFWTNSVTFPFLVDQPVARRIGEILAECFERAARDEFSRTKKFGTTGCR